MIKFNNDILTVDILTFGHILTFSDSDLWAFRHIDVRIFNVCFNYLCLVLWTNVQMPTDLNVRMSTLYHFYVSQFCTFGDLDIRMFRHFKILHSFGHVHIRAFGYVDILTKV